MDMIHQEEKYKRLETKPKVMNVQDPIVPPGQVLLTMRLTSMT